MPGRRRKPRAPARGAILDLPARLERAISDRDWTQDQLAEKSGISQGTISKALNGENLSGIEANTVLALAVALDVPSGWLLAGEGDRIPQRGDTTPAAPESAVVPSTRR